MNRQERKSWKLKRKSKDLTLKELANHLNYSISMVSKYENYATEMLEEKVQQYKEYIENKEV